MTTEIEVFDPVGLRLFFLFLFFFWSVLYFHKRLQTSIKKMERFFLSSWARYYCHFLCIANGFLAFMVISLIAFCTCFIASNTQIGYQHLALFFREFLINSSNLGIVYLLMSASICMHGKGSAQLDGLR